MLYSKALEFFRAEATLHPNLELKEILYEFASIKSRPDDVTAARFLIENYYYYTDLISKVQANVATNS